MDFGVDEDLVSEVILTLMYLMAIPLFQLTDHHVINVSGRCGGGW